MNELEIFFRHPADGRVLHLLVDSNIKGNEIIKKLIELDFLSTNINQLYTLSKEGGFEIGANKTLLDNNVKEGDTLRIIPCTEAGGNSLDEIDVFFIHPSSGKIIHVTLDSTMTGGEIIENLIEANFIKKTYVLANKGGNIIDIEKTLIEVGVKSADIIRLIPPTDAG